MHHERRRNDGSDEIYDGNGHEEHQQDPGEQHSPLMRLAQAPRGFWRQPAQGHQFVIFPANQITV